MGLNDDTNYIPDMQQSDDLIFPEGIPDDDAGRAAAIRAAADGELTEQQAEALTGVDAEISFEHRLREATGRVMGGVSAPAGLRDRIVAAAAASSEDEAMADRLQSRAEETRSPGFWTSGLLNRSRLVGAIAAVLLLGFAGVFISQMSGLNGVGSDTLAYRTDLAQFVSGEHTRTLDEDVAESKYIYKAASDAADAISADLDHEPMIPPCGEHTKFRGASPCGVPGKGPSAHMQFILPGEADGPGRTVSVFVKQDKGELPIEEGTAYLINTQDCKLTDVYICVWRREGLLYTLVSEDSNAPMCAKFLSEFGVDEPDPSKSL